MPRRKVEFGIGDFVHIYNRGANRNRIFLDSDDYLEFLWRWREFVPRTTAQVLAYCLMPNHYHMLLRIGGKDFAQNMQRFGTSFVTHVNRRHGRSGVLFCGRYRAIIVDEIAYLLHLTRYIHLNPVEAKLTPHPEDWEFSSYRDYIGLRRGTLAQPSLILAEFGTPVRYRQFVMCGSASPPGLSRYLIDSDDREAGP